MSALSGARESNAGDEFLVNWTCHRCTELLHPATTLKGLKIEGVSVEDAKGLEDDYFLAADLTEYHGHEMAGPPVFVDFVNSTKVVVAQHKFSTRHPNKGWSAARLCQKRGKSKPRSIIGDFAAVFQAYQEKNNRAQVVEKLSIKLVSNQPLSRKLAISIAEARCFLTGVSSSTNVSAATLVKSLSKDEYRSEIKRLKLASGLSSTAFTDFLRVVDFSDCGVSGLIGQQKLILAALRVSIPDGFVVAHNALYNFVSKQALPDAADQPPVTKYDILELIGVSSNTDIFPAPNLVRPPGRYIKTGVEKELSEAILAAPSRQLLAHGHYGVGKTTVIQNLSEYLPAGSEVVIYDCYGGGTYSDTRNERHSDRRALQQITNEIALLTGKPLLLKPDQYAPDLRRRFVERVAAASKVLAQKNGILVVVVDAADNSVKAAKDRAEECFVPAMWDIPLPNNVRLVMTARTGERAASLEPPDTCSVFEIPSFNEAASAEHLLLHCPSATEEQCQKFGFRTRQNPRLQTYLLANLSSDEVLDQLLEGNPTGLNELFQDRWEAAAGLMERNKGKGSTLNFLGCLTMPLPLKLLKELWSLPTKVVEDVCRNLEPGLLLESGEIRFADEDAEAFAQSQMRPGQWQKANQGICEIFSNFADTNPYVAQHLAKHFESGRAYQQLVDLALRKLVPNCIDDEVLRLSTIHDRLKRAIRVADQIDRRSDVVKLLLLAGEVARAESAVYEIVATKPELAIAFGDPETVTTRYLENESDRNYGESHMRCAAMLARMPSERNRAINHARLASAWLSRRSERNTEPPEGPIRDDPIRIEFLVADAECAFYLNGPESAYRRLSRWRPFSAVFEASWKLGKRVGRELDQRTQSRLWRQLKLHPLIAGALLVEFWKSNNPPSKSLAKQVALEIDSHLQHSGTRRIPKTDTAYSSPNDFAVSINVDLCEALTSLDVPKTLLRRLVQRLAPSMPSYPPYEDMPVQDFDVALRAKSLEFKLRRRTLKLDDVMPQDVDGEAPNLDRQQLERYKSILERFLPIINWRTECLTDKRSVDDRRTEFLKLLKAYSGPQYGVRPDQHFANWAELAIEGILFCKDTDTDLVHRVINKVKNVIPNGAPGVATLLAEKLILDDRYRSAGFEILHKSAETIATSAIPATERWDYFTHCSSLTQPYDHEIARDYFQRAVDAANGLDNDSVYLLKFQASAARTLVGELKGSKSLDTALRLERQIRSLDPYIYDSDPPIPKWEFLEVISRLSPSAGISSLFSWDASEFFGLENSSIPFLRAMMLEGAFNHFEVLSLARLAGERWSPSEFFIEVLSNVKAKHPAPRDFMVKAVPILADWVQRDTALDTRGQAGRKLISWLDENGYMSLSRVKDLREMTEFAESVEQRKKQAGELEIIRRSPTPSRRRSDRKGQTLSRLLRRLPDRSVGRIGEAYKILDTEMVVDPDWKKFFETFRPTSRRSQRIAYLNELSRLPFPRWNLDPLIDELCFCLSNWSADQAVRRWKESGFEEFIVRNLTDVLSYHWSLGEKKIELLLSGFALDDEVLWRTFIKGTTQNLENIGVWQFYFLASLLNGILAKRARCSVLDWAIERSEEFLSQQEPKLPDLLYLEPLNSKKTLPVLVWMLLGHPDKRQRWRTMHAVRTMVCEFGSEILKELTKLDRAAYSPTFAPYSDEFFWISARQYLLFLIRRIAQQRPAAVRPHLSYLSSHALSTDFPHAIVRCLAAEAAIEICSAFPNALPRSRQRQLTSIIKPSLQLPSSEERTRPASGLDRISKSDEGRFSFDATDVVPYWFSSVVRMFDISMPEFLSRAERWICDEWGRSDECSRWNTGVYKRANQWQLFNFSHGSLPTVEMPSTYLQYHSMMLVAGELADSVKIPNKVTEDTDDEWQYWLEFKAPSNSFWISDLRRSTPLEQLLWGVIPTDETWLEPSSSDFFTALGGQKFTEDDWITIAGRVDLHDPSYRASTAISCAVVSANRAHSLMRALQTAENPYDYRVPSEGDELEIDTFGYRFNGFLLDENLEPPMEDEDPIRRQLASRRIGLGTDFRANSGLVIEDLNLGTAAKSEGEKFFEFIAWNDNPDERHVTRFFTEGYQASIRLRELLSYLQSNELSLLIEVQISRKKERGHGSSDQEYRVPDHQIFLVQGNRRIETLGGYRVIGKRSS